MGWVEFETFFSDRRKKKRKKFSRVRAEISTRQMTIYDNDRARGGEKVGGEESKVERGEICKKRRKKSLYV